jgi:hypothetical protein
MSTALPKAKLGAENGLLEAVKGEKELKRFTQVLLGDDPCTVTLTNKRIIITSSTEKMPKELKLSEVVKSKLPGGMFSGGKTEDGKVPELTITLADDSKYKLIFTQYVFSINTAVEERDDFLQMLNVNLGDKENPKAPTVLLVVTLALFMLYSFFMNATPLLVTSTMTSNTSHSTPLLEKQTNLTTLACENRPPSPIPNARTWGRLRLAYILAKASSPDPLWDTPHRVSHYNSGKGGFHVPIKIKFSKGMGRGVFAASKIPKGTLIWDDEQTGRFSTRESWRDFLEYLDEPLACDVLQWAYSMEGNTVGIDLGPGSLMNSGYGDDKNMGPLDQEQVLTMFALKDIMPGQEILCSYDDFVESSPEWFMETMAAIHR